MNGFITYQNMEDVSDMQGQVFNSIQIDFIMLNHTRDI